MSDIIFYHAPQTRSSGVRILLEELGAPYELRPVNMKVGEQRQAAFLAVNPMGKVPAIVDDGALVTEQGAIFLHLADRFPAKALAPAIGDPLRGPYLRWMVFYGSAFEPAVCDHAIKREPGPVSLMPYGTFDATLDTLVCQLRGGPYLLGDRFTAADVLWGTALGWTTMFGVVPKLPEIMAYIERVEGRPAYRRVQVADAALAAEHQAAAEPAG